ncbi:LAMI_0F12090g1_1 [Lachancea mirantina]|uniref:Geranylgeranyl transferase type-2 subunit alpha n=1 Tax=Lachancea mirantina TaxID=1230905 RepID=A0A1G4K310_9SACH|nr:LAMI_0F12090g1_1 [Lachancea mirantina]
MHGVKRRQWTKELLRQKRSNDAMKISNYRALTEEGLTLKRQGVINWDAFDKTTEILNLNPEFNAIWNYRRDLIKALENNLPDKFWGKELSFTLETLKRFPKVYWIWNHRFWSLKRCPGAEGSKWRQELKMVDKILSLDARNFHGWHYRRTVVERIEIAEQTSLNQQELAFATGKINENISNFSAWHQRANLLPKMFANGQIENERQFLKQELDYIITAMFTDAEDQSVWFYINWFIQESCITSRWTKQEYQNALEQLAESAVAINEDEREFSGKDNSWCLKILVIIETIKKQKLGCVENEQRSELLQRLIAVDPVRRERYIYLLNE